MSKLDTQLRQTEDFLKKAYRAALIPGMLSILSGCANILADGILVSRYVGADGLAAVNLCTPVYLILCIVGSFFVSGGAILSAQEMGNNQMKEAQAYYGIAFTACLFFSILTTAAGCLSVNGISRVLEVTGPCQAMVRQYAFVTLAGALPKIMIYIPFWYLRLEGKHKSVTAMMVIMGAGNIVLDVLFLAAFSWGVFGAALASVIATGAACIYGFWRLHAKDASFHMELVLPQKEQIKKMAATGSPAALNNFFQTIRLMAVNGLLLKEGGSALVAVFAVINGISAFTEAVTIGVGQAGSAMLGVYYGERDNQSARILLRYEVKSGVISCGVFGLCLVAGAEGIRRLYGMEGSMYLPMAALALSLLPGMLCNVLTAYYNVSGHAALANGMVFLKGFGFSVASLYLLLKAGVLPWLFLVLESVLTLGFWVLCTGIVHKKENTSRFLLMDQTLEKEGRVINFSTESDDAAICSASEKITDFCEANGMEARQVMRVSLALEELMTLITNKNAPKQVSFDIRVFSVQGVIGIRIRYDGEDFNPLTAGDEEDEQYMGIRMIKKLVEETIYQHTFGMNTLLILI